MVARLGEILPGRAPGTGKGVEAVSITRSRARLATGGRTISGSGTGRGGTDGLPSIAKPSYLVPFFLTNLAWIAPGFIHGKALTEYPQTG